MPFYLKSLPNQDGSRLIYLRYAFQTRNVVISTGLTIQPEDWDNGRPKRSFKHAVRYSRILDKYARLAEEVYLDMILEGAPTKDEFKAEFFKRLNPEAPLTVWEYALKYAETKKEIDTKQAYIRVAFAIKGFNPRITFDRIDMGVMADFRDFLLSEKKLGQNTAAKMYQRLKTVLNEATEKGLNTNLTYKTRKVSIKAVDSTAIFLDEQELEQIYKADLPEQLHKYRDLFLVSAFTGTRYSDIWKISKASFENKHGSAYFRITDKKEGSIAHIPAHPMTLEIMEKYDWNLPKVSNPKLNKRIKDVARIAKINKEIIETTYPGGVRTDVKREKWELLTVHSGRRSLICNLLLNNVQREVIMSISGHRSYSAFRRYIKLTPSDMLSVAFKSGFFNKTKFKVIA